MWPCAHSHLQSLNESPAGAVVGGVGGCIMCGHVLTHSYLQPRNYQQTLSGDTQTHTSRLYLAPRMRARVRKGRKDKPLQDTKAKTNARTPVHAWHHSRAFARGQDRKRRNKSEFPHIYIHTWHRRRALARGSVEWVERVWPGPARRHPTVQALSARWPAAAGAARGWWRGSPAGDAVALGAGRPVGSTE